jgi:hypothetical protein
MRKLSSQDRIPSSVGSHDFILSNNAVVWKGEYKLVDALIPITMLNINSSNNVVQFNEGGGPLTATIAPGYYTNSSLITAVATAMTTASTVANTYTATLNSLTNTLTIAAANNFFMQNALVSRSAAVQMAAMLGFPAGVNTASAISQTGTSSVSVNRLLAFNILIDQCENTPPYGLQNGQGNTFTMSIPLIANTNSIEYHRCQDSSTQIVRFQNPTTYLHVRAVDDAMNTINLQGADWFVTLKTPREEDLEEIINRR